MNVKEKFNEIKVNVKQKIKDHPELIGVGVSIAMLGTAILLVRSADKEVEKAIQMVRENNELLAERRKFTGLHMCDETFKTLLEDPSRICYKFDDDHHYSLAPNGCTEDH